MRFLSSALALAALSLSTPALAQVTDPAPLPDPNQREDYFSIGIGPAFTADYEGSNDYRLIPGAVFRARTGGVTISTRGTYLYADLIDGSSDVSIDVGPIVGVRLNRTGKIKDDVVDELDDRKAAFELGGFAGVTFSGLTNPYDALSIRVDAVKDVGNAHESWVISPVLDFGTPLSLTTFVGASVSADFTTDKFADYYFGIDLDDSLDSGLPLFEADGGMKSWQVGLLASQSLSGDLRKGWALFATGNFKRLVGDFADSPIVDDRGSRTQWFGALGVGYTF